VHDPQGDPQLTPLLGLQLPPGPLPGLGAGDPVQDPALPQKTAKRDLGEKGGRRGPDSSTGRHDSRQGQHLAWSRPEPSWDKRHEKSWAVLIRLDREVARKERQPWRRLESSLASTMTTTTI
jgi:hypothetical protein